MSSGVSYARYMYVVYMDFKTSLSENAKLFIKKNGVIHLHCMCNARQHAMCSEAKTEMKAKHSREIGS